MLVRLRQAVVEATDTVTWTDIARPDASPADVLRAVAAATKHQCVLLENLDDSHVLDTLTHAQHSSFPILVTTHRRSRQSPSSIDVGRVSEPFAAVKMARAYLQTWVADVAAQPSDEEILRVAGDICNWRPYLIARIFAAYGRHLYSSGCSWPHTEHHEYALNEWIAAHGLETAPGLHAVDNEHADTTMYRGRTVALVNSIRREALYAASDRQAHVLTAVKSPEVTRSDQLCRSAYQ